MNHSLCYLSVLWRIFFNVFFLAQALLVLSWLCPFCLSSGWSRQGKHFTAVLHHPNLTSREMEGRLKGSHASEQPTVVHNALYCRDSLAFKSKYACCVLCILVFRVYFFLFPN